MFYSVIFAQAVVAMTEDKSFRLQTPQASRALKIGFLISENIPSDDNAALEGLSKYLVDSLNDCILDSTYSHKQSVNSVLEGVDVQYNRCLCSYQLEEEERDELLKLIAVKYITIRGFSFTSSVMELYKQQNYLCMYVKKMAKL